MRNNFYEILIFCIVIFVTIQKVTIFAAVERGIGIGQPICSQKELLGLDQKYGCVNLKNTTLWQLI